MSEQKKDKTEYLADGSDWLFSLSKYIGKKVIDIQGYPSDPFGGNPVFVVVCVVFDDGTEASIEGEHDTPYLCSDDKLQNMDEETLQSWVSDDE